MIKTCKDCGKEFETPNVKRLFCCKKCASHFHNQKQRELKGTADRPRKKTCIVCGKTFVDETQNNLRTICSKECLRLRTNELRRKKRTEEKHLMTSDLERYAQRRASIMQGLTKDSIEARDQNTTYGQYKAEEYARKHPMSHSIPEGYRKAGDK